MLSGFVQSHSHAPDQNADGDVIGNVHFGRPRFT
jgi:hypothetical protein